MTAVYDEAGNYLGDDGVDPQQQMTQEQYQYLLRQQQMQQQQQHQRDCAVSLAPVTPFKRANFFDQMNTNVNHLQKRIRRV